MSENTNENIKDENLKNKKQEIEKNGLNKVELEKNGADKIESESGKTENIKDNKKGKVKKSPAREAIEWVVCVIIAFSLALFIKYLIFTPTLVMQESMTPTILNGERVLINRLVRTFDQELNRGDIITFEAPVYSTLQDNNITAMYYERENIIDAFFYNVMEIEKISYIKRVIGVAGDKIRIENGRVYLNDKLLEEDYIKPGAKTIIPEGGMPSEFIVPEGYIFAMGDNREGSADCRAFGCIPLEKVEGRVTMRIWPLNKLGSIDK